MSSLIRVHDNNGKHKHEYKNMRLYEGLGTLTIYNHIVRAKYLIDIIQPSCGLTALSGVDAHRLGEVDTHLQHEEIDMHGIQLDITTKIMNMRIRELNDALHVLLSYNSAYHISLNSYVDFVSTSDTHTKISMKEIDYFSLVHEKDNSYNTVLTFTFDGNSVSVLIGYDKLMATLNGTILPKSTLVSDLFIRKSHVKRANHETTSLG